MTCNIDCSIVQSGTVGMVEQKVYLFYSTFTHTRRMLYTATRESRQTGHDLTIATAYIVSTCMSGEDGLTLTSYLSSGGNSILPNLVL